MVWTHWRGLTNWFLGMIKTADNGDRKRIWKLVAGGSKRTGVNEYKKQLRKVEVGNRQWEWGRWRF